MSGKTEPYLLGVSACQNKVYAKKFKYISHVLNQDSSIFIQLVFGRFTIEPPDACTPSGALQEVHICRFTLLFPSSSYFAEFAQTSEVDRRIICVVHYYSSDIAAGSV